MASGPTCHKRLLLTGFKAAGTRHCSEACADGALLPASNAALEAPPPRTTEIPRGTATVRLGPDDSLLVDREGVKPGLVIAGGILAAVLLSIGLHALESMADWQVRGMNLWIVLPIGAALDGGLITAGFFAAARLLDTRPRLSTSIAAIATAGAPCWPTYVIGDGTMSDDSGAPVRESLGFGEFMRIIVEESTISLGKTSGTAVTAGGWDFGLYAAKWIGFFLGAWFIVRWAGFGPFYARFGRLVATLGHAGRSGAAPTATSPTGGLNAD